MTNPNLLPPQQKRLAFILAKVPLPLLLVLVLGHFMFPTLFKPILATTFGFLLFYGLLNLIRTFYCLLGYNKWNQAQLKEVTLMAPLEKRNPEHIIIITMYKEDLETLYETLDVMSNYRQAARITICLATEERDQTAAAKVNSAKRDFSSHFKDIVSTVHPNLPEDAVGKGSNTAWAFKTVIQNEPANHNTWDIIHVLDVDTHHQQDYFDRIEATWGNANPDDRGKFFFACPIVFNRNHKEVAWPVRIADSFWSMAGLSSMYPGSNFITPTSTYSLSCELALKMNGWDASDFGIGEDFHTIVRAYCGSGGDIIMKSIYTPASSLHVTRDRCNMTSWWGDVYARYQQACRHLFGILTLSYLIEQFVNSPKLLLRYQSWFVLFRSIEPLSLLYLFIISWLNIPEGQTWVNMVINTWLNGIWMSVAYVILTVRILSAWNFAQSKLQIAMMVFCIMAFGPFMLVAFTGLPIINAIFFHVFRVSYSGWVTTTKKQPVVKV